MLPDNYVGLLVADTRRAMQWEAGLRAADCEVVRVETRGSDADKGAWQIGVHRRDAARARALMTAVLGGRAKLPHPPLLSRSGTIALLAIGALLVALIGLALLTR